MLVWSKNSCGLPVVIFQQPFPKADWPVAAIATFYRRKDKDVVLALSFNP